VAEWRRLIDTYLVANVLPLPLHMITQSRTELVLSPGILINTYALVVHIPPLFGERIKGNAEAESTGKDGSNTVFMLVHVPYRRGGTYKIELRLTKRL